MPGFAQAGVRPIDVSNVKKAVYDAFFETPRFFYRAFPGMENCIFSEKNCPRRGLALRFTAILGKPGRSLDLFSPV